MRMLMLLVLVALPGLGQTAKPCADPEYRQFDFWVGKWRVETPDGKVVGTNDITRILGGCVLHEKWNGASGLKGESFNIYDKSRGVWHQSWVDTSGLLLQIEGKLTGGKMVLTGTRKTPEGSIMDRITWSKSTTAASDSTGKTRQTPARPGPTHSSASTSL